LVDLERQNRHFRSTPPVVLKGRYAETPAPRKGALQRADTQQLSLCLPHSHNEAAGAPQVTSGSWMQLRRCGMNVKPSRLCMEKFIHSTNLYCSFFSTVTAPDVQDK
jgi:hypothetical protein